MQVEAENAGFQWIGVTRDKGKGGGVGILIKSHLQWQRRSDLTENVIWIHVKGIGHVAGVHAPPSGSSNHDPPFIDITNCLATGVKANRLKERVWIMGETNAKIGEMPNEVGEARTPRTSEDKVVNQRGRDLMRALNAEGMWAVKGNREKAAVTFENHSGASCRPGVDVNTYVPSVTTL